MENSSFFEDYRRLESFRDDPAISDAAETIRQELKQDSAPRGHNDGRNVKCEKYRESGWSSCGEQYPKGSRISID